jgi:hypothetical protein
MKNPFSLYGGKMKNPGQFILFCLLTLALCSAVAFAEKNGDESVQLVSKIDYQFAGHLEQTDEQGRLLVWQGTVEGDLNGEIKWWFVRPTPVPNAEYTGGAVSFYSAYWEIRNDGKLVLAGQSAGKTVFPDGTDGIWDGHGVVTHGDKNHKKYEGRKIYETGPVVTGPNPPVSFSGSGMFQVY